MAAGAAELVRAGVAGADVASTFAMAPHPVSGIGEFTADHANGYWQPAMAVTLLAVSLGSAQPSGAEDVADGNCSGGSVTIASVLVYCGRNSTLCAGTFAMVVGGQTPNVSREVAAIVPAPAPPVCQGW